MTTVYMFLLLCSYYPNEHGGHCIYKVTFRHALELSIGSDC